MYNRTYYFNGTYSGYKGGIKMNEIKQWTLGITVSAIVGAIILFISPDGSTEKLVRTAVSLFLMCAILSPFITNADPMEIFNSIKKQHNIQKRKR